MDKIKVTQNGEIVKIGDVYTVYDETNAGVIIRTKSFNKAKEAYLSYCTDVLGIETDPNNFLEAYRG